MCHPIRVGNTMLTTMALKANRTSIIMLFQRNKRKHAIGSETVTRK